MISDMKIPSQILIVVYFFALLGYIGFVIACVTKFVEFASMSNDMSSINWLFLMGITIVVLDFGITGLAKIVLYMRDECDDWRWEIKKRKNKL